MDPTRKIVTEYFRETWRPFGHQPAERPDDHRMTKQLCLCGFRDGSGRLLQRMPKVKGVFRMRRSGSGGEHGREESQHQMRKDSNTYTLLWHGTNVACAAAICNAGLRIMPHSRGRLGRGIYLTSQANKAGFYCQRTDSGSLILFLAEVCLGRKFEVTEDTAARAFRSPPFGYDSVVALGTSITRLHRWQSTAALLSLLAARKADTHLHS